jgi:Tfp pilus tip-associated adhesin PilY1
MMNNPYQGWRYNWYGTRMLVRITANGARQIYNVIDNVKAGGGTYLLNGMNLARQEFAGRYSPIIKGADCQQNYLIVISDGDWAQASSVNSIARQMARQDPSIKTFVVGFATGGNKPNYSNLASAGGTVTPLFAENEDQLFAKLTEAIKQITGSTLTFTAPAISTDARSNDYIYQSTFTYSKNNQWKGFLKKYSLNANGSFGNMIWDAGTLLNNKSSSSRKIWTVGTGNINLNNVTTSNLTVLKNKFFTTSVTDSDATKLINFIRGSDSYDEDGDGNTSESRHKLGDIYHSNINIVGKPNGSLQYANEFQTGFYRSQNGYSNFMAQHSGRRETIYVGANDGMLHAFDAITGNELWAFIPPSLHSKLSTMISTKANSTNSIYGVDGSSSVKDVYIDGEWKTVLISSLGAGGHSFFALDITDPNNPKHLFTIKNDSSNQIITFWDENGSEEVFSHNSINNIENDYRKLGETWSTPRIVKLKINNVDKWVAIAGGGYNGATNPNYGSAVFIIDLENNGKLINKIDIQDKSSIDIVNSIPSDLTIITADSTENAKYHGALVYAFDLEGKITKINLTDQGNLYDQTEIFDSESNTTNGRFLYKKASATIIDDKLWFYYGTGNTQKLQDKTSNTLNRLYGIKDKYFPNFTSVTTPPTIKQCKTAPNCPNSADTGWYVNLKNGQKLSDEPTIDNDRVYFPIYEPTDGVNVCKTGKAILSAYSSTCGNSLLNINLGAGVLTQVVKNNDNLYIGISGEADTSGTGFSDKDNLLTGKSQSKTTGGKVQLEGWKENY